MDTRQRVLNGVALVVILFAVVELGIFLALRDWNMRFGRSLTIVGFAGVLVSAGVATAAILGRLGTPMRRLTLLVSILGLLGAIKIFSDRWPEAPARSRYVVYETSDSAAQVLPVEGRLRWAARIAAHAISTGGRNDETLRIPRSWPFPPSSQIHVQDGPDSHVVIAVETGSGRACRFTLYTRVQVEGLTGRGEPLHCSDSLPSAPAVALAVERTDGATASGAPVSGLPPLARDAATTSWPQYRRDAARIGVAASRGIAGGSWMVPLDGEVRATASLVGERLFLGTHGPGALHVVDAKAGRLLWMRYLPNWVHQDAVSDGRTVVVGFGDNETSLVGEAPSGVSAFDLGTGAHRWSSYEGNSVMTSAVLWRDRVVSITSAGLLRVRDLASGAETGKLLLDGRATMAPPVLIGDTLVATLDSTKVCAVDLAVLASKWCAQIEGTGMMGHAAPAVIDGKVIVSAAVFNPRRGRGPVGTLWQNTKAMLGWTFGEHEYEGQRVMAFDLATGRELWRTPVYPTQHAPAGHSSGTAVFEDGVGVIVLPLSGVTVGFDVATGVQSWALPTGAARGPPAHANGRLYLTLRAGELRVVSVATGAIECAVPTSSTFDRIGPPIADGMLYPATTRGMLFAMPLELLTRCAKEEIVTLLGAPAPRPASPATP